MRAIQIPKRLGDLLRYDPYEHPVHLLCDQVARIISPSSGGCPFFPHFTDHGPRHVEDVLKSEVDLIPKEVWEESQPGAQGHRILTAADAAVLIGGTLLHDIAMHLHPAGFKKLVSKESQFRPIAWFDAPREGHPGDRPWHELWADFEREARKFSERQLTDIIGEEEARAWTFDGLPQSEGQWTENHRLIVGEFIRRHHARLAHEIALYGFPGLTPRDFPAMGDDSHRLSDIADLIGLVARSHGISLRLCKEYIESNSNYKGSPRPKGTAVLYPMALLRVADYLQIDKNRAPAVLLNLGKPQSPISIREWTSHQSVRAIEVSNDPRARMIRVKPDIPLPLFLHLQDLIYGIQKEIDHSTAVLDESYGLFSRLGLDQLVLAIRRVHSNLLDPDFQKRLPYIPRRTSFSTDPNLLSLLVEPLYGKHPGVGVRELIQNAVDAVRERKAWNQTHPNPHATPETDDGWDVLVEFIHQPNGPWKLRVEDKGIGMSPDTLENYFLRAGASFRDSLDWRRDFVGDDGKPRLARSGRFGIGVFAAFLLGDSIQVQTRHAGSKGGSGHALEAAHNSQLIEIKRVSKSSVGTVVEIPIRAEAAEILGLDVVTEEDNGKLHSQVDWYCGTWPRLRMQVVKAGQSIELAQSHRLPSPADDLPPEWSIIRPEGFDAVLWTFGDAPNLVCNNFLIGLPARVTTKTRRNWFEFAQFKTPRVVVVDSTRHLNLRVQRYSLSSHPPFMQPLARDMSLSVIGHFLVCGPSKVEEVLRRHMSHPLAQGSVEGESTPFTNFLITNTLIMASNGHFMAPFDPWFCSVLGCREVFVSQFSNIPGDFMPTKSRLSRPHKIIAQWVGQTHQPTLVGPYGYPHYFLGTHCLIESGVEVTSVFIGMDEKHLYSAGLDDGSSPFEDPAWKAFDLPGNHSWTAYQSGSDDPVAKALFEDLFTEASNSDDLETWLVAKLHFHGEAQPQSLLACTWNEVLCPRAIPFDPAARALLVEHGRRHPELRAHIERWEKMKAANSKWVRGELLDSQDG